MSTSTTRVPIKEGLFSGPLDDLQAVHLCGSRCASCGETTLGAAEVCPNCGSDELTTGPLGDRGTLYTYTIVRHRPPGNYRGSAEFKPFGIGLIEIDGVIRVMAPLLTQIDEIQIGMPLEFHPYVLRTDDNGAEVVAFAYAAQGAQS